MAHSLARLFRDEAWLSKFVRVNASSLQYPIEPRGAMRRVRLVFEDGVEQFLDGGVLDWVGYPLIRNYLRTLDPE